MMIIHEEWNDTISYRIATETMAPEMGMEMEMVVPCLTSLWTPRMIANVLLLWKLEIQRDCVELFLSMSRCLLLCLVVISRRLFPETHGKVALGWDRDGDGDGDGEGDGGEDERWEMDGGIP